MTDQTDFDTHLAAIQAIPTDNIKRNTIPIGIYAQEAENLYHWASQDSALLTGTGLPADFIEQLAVRVGVLREAEARWQAEYRMRKEAEVAWSEASPAAYDLRDELLRSFRYAFRKDDSLLQRVSMITEGDGHADMIQDLTTLAVLGRQHTDKLASIHFDESKLELAANTADTIAGLLAQANGDKLAGNDGRELRDKAYTYLKEVVDEVRACGKYVFHGNENRLVGYSSAYYRKFRKATEQAPAETAEA